MDRMEYLNLKNIDFSIVRRFILDSLDDIKINDEQIKLASIAYLTLHMIEDKSLTLLSSPLELSLLFNVDLEFQNWLKEFFSEKDVIKTALSLSKRFTKEELLALALHVPTHRYSYKDHFETPNGVAKLAVKLLDIKPDDIVLDLGSGLGNFLIEATFNSKSNLIYGIENDRNNYRVSILRHKLLKFNNKIIEKDIFEYNLVSGLNANKVFSHFPFRNRYSELRKSYLDRKENDLNIKTANHFNSLEIDFYAGNEPYSAEWAYILTALQTLKYNSNAKVVVLASQGVINIMSDEDIRREIIQKRLIEGIITLPENILSFTNLATKMIVFSYNNNDIKMVDATKWYADDRRNKHLNDENINEILKAYKEEGKISKFVTYQEIVKTNFKLSPQFYLNVPEFKIKHSPLGDLITDKVQRGMIISAKDLASVISEKETDIQYLELNNITNGIISPDIKHIHAPKEFWEKHCVENRQLIISRTYPYKIAIVEKKTDKYLLATGNLYFMNINEDIVNPYYLAAYLESSIGQAELERYSTGSAIKMLSISSLNKVKVPIMSQEQQTIIANKYKEMNALLFNLKEELQSTKEKKSDLFTDKV